MNPRILLGRELQGEDGSWAIRDFTTGDDMSSPVLPLLLTHSFQLLVLSATLGMGGIWRALFGSAQITGCCCELLCSRLSLWQGTGAGSVQILEEI